MKISGWGRFPIINATVSSPRTETELIECIKQGNAIARGNGRSYGDSSISPTNTICMLNFNRMLNFDVEEGCLTAESGVLLEDIVKIFVPRGWFPYVTPGTKFVTLGGMIAANVHGKNHHKNGSFGNFVEWLDIISNQGDVVRCSRTQNPDLFKWTIGGMGLTGVIIRAAIKLRPISSAFIAQRTLAAANISELMDMFKEHKDATYSVAWIDCQKTGKTLGRSLLLLGEHADDFAIPEKYKRSPLLLHENKRKRIPFELPVTLVNNFSVRFFNSFYYLSGKYKNQKKTVSIENYFYPLDYIHGWNKIYGKGGFVQFQCVLPFEHSKNGINQLLRAIAKSRCSSFLAVLKVLGEDDGGLSFPMKGYTLALDFPINKKVLTLLHELDRITLQNQGRFYLAKDSRLTRKTFLKSEARAASFQSFRQNLNIEGAFNSSQSKRIGL